MSWQTPLAPEFDKPYWHELQHFVASQRATFEVYPRPEDVYNAFVYTSFERTRVVILGQDPYHGQGQADGLCFSVQPPTPPPPSLRNILKELNSDKTGNSDSAAAGVQVGSLRSWAEQGVLLLNTTLTVRENEPGSHQGRGWETFTDAVIAAISNNPDAQVVFILWGAAARKKQSTIDERHTIITSPHPSPLAAHRGFFGSRPFSRANTALAAAGQPPIRWRS